MSFNRAFVYVCGLISVIIISGITCFVVMDYNTKAVERNAQTEVEKQKIINETQLNRTKERMKIFPWYKND